MGWSAVREGNVGVLREWTVAFASRPPTRRGFGGRGLARLRHAVGTPPPVDDLGFVDLEALIVHGHQARGRPDGAFDVGEPAADPADQMVVVVAEPLLVARRRTERLNPPDQTRADQEAQSVVDGLQRDRTDLGPDRLRDLVGGDVRSAGDRPQHRETLRGDLNSAFAEKAARVLVHEARLDQSLE